MKKVLIYIGKDRNSLRQTPGSLGIWRSTPENGLKDDYQFVLPGTPEAEEYDFVVVRGKCMKQATPLHVAPQNVVLTTSEPRSVFDFPKDYLRQFGVVMSCQDTMRGENVVMSPPLLVWFDGLRFDPDGVRVSRTYDDYLAEPLEPAAQRKKLISVACSNKAFSPGHQERLRFVKRLKQHFGDQLDVFGRGFKDFADKRDVLADYQYHIAIENSSSDYYFTEKLMDCYLAGSYPIYYGCPNVLDYFPEEALCRIDIRKTDEAIAAIEACIARKRAETSAKEMQECRRLVLDDYNMFYLIARQLDALDADAPKQDITLQPCHSMHSWRNFWHYTFQYSYYKVKYKLFG